MQVKDVLRKGLLESGSVVAGHQGLQRDLSWVHVVELPEPWQWIDKDQLLLTTGFSWTKDEDDHRRRIRDLNGRGIAAIALAVPSYLKHFPDVAKYEADALGLPLIEIPWELPFSRISESINREIISRQHRFREHSMNIHRSLTRSAIEAESLAEIVGALASLIDRSVVLEDAEGTILAVSALDKSPLPTGTDSSLGSVGRLLNPSEWTDIKKSHHAATRYWRQKEQWGSVVIGPVWLKEEFVGVIWMPEVGEPSGILGLQAAEHAATVIALQIARERNVAMVEQRLKLTLLDSLLEGEFADDSIGMERAMLMGIDPYGSFQVVVFSFPESLPLNRAGYLKREQFSERVSRRLKQLGMPLFITSALNEVHVVLQGTLEADALIQSLDIQGAIICVGRKFNGVHGVQMSFREAKSLLDWAKPGIINTFDGLLLPRLLHGDQDAKATFIQKWTAPFDSVLHGDVYLETLREFTKAGFNQRIASGALSIHPKTMQYRASRIAQLLGVDLTDAETRFELQLLFQLAAT